MIQPQPPHGLSQTGWFGWIQRLRLFLKVDVAIGTGASAGWSHDQECGRSGIKAFANIGTGGFFANCVETEVAQNFFDVADSLPLRGFHPQPFWFNYHADLALDWV